MKCGDIVTILYPFTDMSGSKVRPALIVSNNEFNGGDDLILVPISSAPEENDPHAYPIKKNSPAFPASGLKFNSSVKWTKPMALSKTIIQKRLGNLDIKLLAEIKSKIRVIFD